MHTVPEHRHAQKRQVSERPVASGPASGDAELEIVPKSRLGGRESVLADGVFRGIVVLCALAVLAIVGLIVFELVRESRLAMGKFGLMLLVELLAAIPSVIYGLWGIFVLSPFLRLHVEPFLGKYFGWTGLFTGPKYGWGMLAAGVILAIMILPIVASITREVITAVPRVQREAALALGATKWEMLRMA